MVIKGGVTSPKGFTANAIFCGLKKNPQKKDLSLIVSDSLCSVAAVYTTNVVKGAPLIVTKQNISNGEAQAVVCNSGNANTCNENGIEIAQKMCEIVEKHTSVKKENVVVASTGVIGQPLDVSPIEANFETLVQGLGSSLEHSHTANKGILTTDTMLKSCAIKFKLDNKEITIGGMAKGSGMIHPNMATMLVFITTDCAISSKLLKSAIQDDTKASFNMVSVDGDTSTNDMYVVLANGKAENELIKRKNASYYTFKSMLNEVTTFLCKQIAKDGEGATKLIECVVSSKNIQMSRTLARSVISSNLVKAAMFGADANWGRVLCAMGYSGVKFDVNKVNAYFESGTDKIKVCENGQSLDFDEELAKKILTQKEIKIVIDIGKGKKTATAWGCDLTYDYVKINGDYRT